MRTTHRIIAFLAPALAAVSAHAVPILGVDPATNHRPVGSQVNLDVSISELSGQLIGAYDLRLSFDDSILDLEAITFGPFLDAPLGLSIPGFIESPGSVDVFEVSFGLLLSQDGSTPFSLFTATFDVVGAGTSPLDLDVNAIGDFFGEPLDVRTRGSSVTAVPAPGTLALLAAGLLVLAGTAFMRIRRGRADILLT